MSKMGFSAPTFYRIRACAVLLSNPFVCAVLLPNAVMIETSDREEGMKHSEDMSNGSTTSHATISHDAESKVDLFCTGN